MAIDTDKRNAEADKKFAQYTVEADKRHAETTKSLDKLDKSIDKLKIRIQNLSDMYGGVSKNLGDEAELDFTQALTENPSLSNITFDQVIPNLTRKIKQKNGYACVFKKTSLST